MQPQKPRQFADITPPKTNVIRPTNLDNLSPAQPTVTKIPVQNFAPPLQINNKIFTPLTPVQPQAPPAPKLETQDFIPPQPATPPAEVPKFGALQSKIDSHPLFSGATEQPPKKPRGLIGKLLWILAILLVIGATIYVIIDSGAVNTNINLPFHIFKQATTTTTPTITTTTTSDPYAGWASYSDNLVSFKYPSSWHAVRNDNTSLPNTSSLELTTTADALLSSITSVPASSKATLKLTVFKSVAGKVTLKSKVYDILQLTNSALPNSQLVVTSDIRQGGDPTTAAMNLLVTDDQTIKIGGQAINDYLTIGSSSYLISVTILSDSVPDNTITNLQSFEANSTVKDIIKVINNLTLK